MIQPIRLEPAADSATAADADEIHLVQTILDDPACRIYEFGEGIPSPIPRPFRTPQYHYTSVDALNEMFSERRIRTCPWVDEERLPENDYHPTYDLICDVAWTSAHPVFEVAATAADCMSRDRHLAICDMLDGDPVPVARIEVDPSVLFGWSPYLYMVGVTVDRLSHLVGLAEEIGSDPDDWAVCPRPIASSAWLGVDVWNGDDWIPIAKCEESDMQDLVRRLPVQCVFNDRQGLSAGGAWVKDMRQRGGADWFAVLSSDRIFRLEANGHFRNPTTEEIQEIIMGNDSLHPLYRVLMAIQSLPDECAVSVIKEVGAEAFGRLEKNPEFARSVQELCGVDRRTLIREIKRRYARFQLELNPDIGP